MKRYSDALITEAKFIFIHKVFLPTDKVKVLVIFQFRFEDFCNLFI